QFTDYSLNYEVRFISLPTDDHVEIFSDKKITVIAHKVKHRIPCWAFEFKQNYQIRNLKKECISQYGLTIAQISGLKQGKDVLLENSKFLLNKEVTYLVPKVSYVYITDTRFLSSLTNYIQNPTVLYHEATFDSSLKKRAKETYHSTSDQAALFAKTVGAQKLI